MTEAIRKLPAVDLKGEGLDLRLFGPGVYHLMLGDEVAYVGASICLAGRVNSWIKLIDGETRPSWLGCQFDGVRVHFAESEAQAAAMEQAHIALLKPRFNRAGVDAPYMSPEGIWRKRKGRFSARLDTYGDRGECVYSRHELLQRLPGDIGTTKLRAFRLVPGGNLSTPDYLLALYQSGFPEPDYASNKGRPQWFKATVAAWLDANAPFEDEYDADSAA